MPEGKPRLAALNWKKLFSPQKPPTSSLFAHLPTLETPRLLLRPLKLSDAEDMYAYASDPEVARHVLWDAHRSIRDTRAFLRWMLERYRLGMPGDFGIWHKGDQRLIGTAGFSDWKPEDGTAEIGYSLSRAYWGQDIATEALEALLAFCFGKLMLHRVEGQHTLENPASGRVMEKAGMQREGVHREKYYNKTKYVDTVSYAILQSDWKQLHPAEMPWKS